jgi:hypothetical protein
MSLATVLPQLVPSDSSVFTPCNWACEHQASMEVVKMSFEILDSTHGLPCASFAVTFVAILLGLIIVTYYADFFHRSR